LIARVIVRKTLFALLFCATSLLGSAAAEEFSVQSFDMRGDMGLLDDFGPTGASWAEGNRILVCDRRYNVFHLFDLEGRRYRFMDYPHRMSDAHFNGLCHWKDNQFFVTGSHYHPNNNTRIVESRSEMREIRLVGEQIDPASDKQNYRPDRALRASYYYGESTELNGEITGIAFDTRNNRVFLGISQCVARDGNVVLLEGKLDQFLARSNDFELKFLNANLKPEMDPNLKVQYSLSDLAYLPGKGLVLLFSARSEDGKSFGANQIWFMKGGFGPAKLVKKDLAIGNRGSGIALRPSSTKDEYEAAIVCDNNMEDTKIPSRLLLLKGLRFPMR